MCELGYSILKDAGYYAVRRGIRGNNPIIVDDGTSPGDWFNLKCYGIGDTDIEDERLQWVIQAWRNEEWLIEMWHNVRDLDDVDGYQAIDCCTAEKHIRNIKEFSLSHNMWCAKFTDAVRYLKEKTAARVVSYYENNCLYIGAFFQTRF